MSYDIEPETSNHSSLIIRQVILAFAVILAPRKNGIGGLKFQQQSEEGYGGQLRANRSQSVSMAGVGCSSTDF